MMIVSSNTKKIKNKNKKNKHKYNKKNSNDKNKNNKNINIKNIKLTKKKQQLEHKMGKEKDIGKKDISNTTKLVGGSSNNNKEGFEVKRLTDIDYDQFKLSKYMIANIDWGNSPGTPPTDCCIM